MEYGLHLSITKRRYKIYQIILAILCTKSNLLPKVRSNQKIELSIISSRNTIALIFYFHINLDNNQILKASNNNNSKIIKSVHLLGHLLTISQ